MRSAQVYRWQIPMDAGVVLRDRRLKTRDGLYVCLREGEREGWGEISPLPGFSQETWEEAQSVLLAWVNNWLAGDCELPQMPSVAFGVSCALAELADTLPQAANYRAAPLCNGDPDDLILKPVSYTHLFTWPLMAKMLFLALHRNGYGGGVTKRCVLKRWRER